MIANQFGLGSGGVNSAPHYYITPGCPLHEYGIAYHDEQATGLATERPRVQAKGDRVFRVNSSTRNWRDILFKSKSLGRDRSDS